MYRSILALATITGLTAPYTGHSVARVEQRAFDGHSPVPLRISPSLISIVEAPCEIEEYAIGSAKQFQVASSSLDRKRLYISSRVQSAAGTNLYIRCKEEFFLVDLIPDQLQHQDLLFLTKGARNRPQRDLVLIDSSERGSK